MRKLNWVGRVGAVLGLATLSLGPVTANAATVTWGGNGHEYQLVIAEGITWTAAEAAVDALGAGWYLATITDAAEQTFANSLLPTGLVDRSHFWLGGSDAATEGTWTWVTPEPFTYTNWWGGEPNDQGNEDYLTLDYRVAGGDTRWNDLANGNYTYVRGYVIERLAPVPLPAAAWLLLSGLAGFGFVGRRRKTH